MKQKVAIACALIHDPKALLFDEPLTGLDPLGIRKMKQTIVARGSSGAAIVVSSHLLHLVEEICTPHRDHRSRRQGRRRDDGGVVGAGGGSGIVAGADLSRGHRPGILMLSTLASLAFWQVKNRIRVRLARLKQPRYLVGSIAGIAYISYFAILRNPGFSRGRGAAAANFARVAGPTGAGRRIVTAAARGARLDPACRRKPRALLAFRNPVPVSRSNHPAAAVAVSPAPRSARPPVRQCHGHACS